ncbi:MAG TPA: secretion protein HlyD, partial [Massilia sp.]|nr:secretion protein HlyD [Massilia sp.]
KIVQRVPVKITLSQQDQQRLAGRLVPGMSVVAEIDLRQKAEATRTASAK